jgi:hypothetical protein
LGNVRFADVYSVLLLQTANLRNPSGYCSEKATVTESKPRFNGQKDSTQDELMPKLKVAKGRIPLQLPIRYG